MITAMVMITIIFVMVLLASSGSLSYLFINTSSSIIYCATSIMAADIIIAPTG